MLWKLPLAWRNRVALLIRTGNIRTQRIADLLRLNAPEIESVYPLLRQLNSKETVNRLLNTSASGSTLFQSLLQLQPTIGRFPLLSQLSMAELKGYTRQTLLKDTDQMSMAQALEVREPFFDHELVEYVLGLPDTCKQGSPSKSLLVHALGTAIPPAIYNRPKKGFVLPGEQWFRNELTAFCADKMMQLSQRDFIHGNALKQYWNDFLAGRNAIRWTHILLLLALENYIQLHRLE